MCDFEEPKVFSSDLVKARKNYYCFECSKERILVGDKYTRIKGLWEDRWEEFKVCKRCSFILTRLRDLPGHYGECLAFGKLLEEFKEYQTDKREYKKYESNKSSVEE